MKHLSFSVLIFTVVFVLFASLEAQTSCTLDVSILNSDAEHYFAFKGIGRINEDSHASDPDFASLVTTELVGIGGKDLAYGREYSFFYEYNDSGEKGVGLTVSGDPDMTDYIFKTFVVTAIPVTYLELMREQDIDRLPFAPVLEVKSAVLSKDENHIKYCTIASNKKSVSEEFGEVGVGQFQVCLDNNTDFSAGETFRLAMMAELVVGQEMLENYEDAETFDDLCDCFDKNNERVDCSTIEWKESGDTEGSDAESYFEFKGKGILNKETEKHPTYITGSTVQLVGVEGKEISSPSSFFLEYDLPGTDFEHWVALEVLGDFDTLRYPATVVFVLIPGDYLNYMIEEDLKKLQVAPITQVLDYSFSSDHIFAKRCVVAMNKQGFSDLGETGIGEFQVDLDNNIDFSAGEVFDLTMRAELVVGQELIDSYEDVETEADLCSCYRMANDEEVDCSEIDWGGDDDNDDESDSDDTESDTSEDDQVNTDDDTVDADDTGDSEDQTDDADPSTEKEKGKSGCSMLFI